MSKKNFFIKSAYSFILFNLLFWNFFPVARAELFPSDIPSAADILNDIEEHYGFDQNILRRSEKKADYPRAEVFFDRESPEKGDKVTATAVPKYFKNSNENLYYTWFLLREGDSLSSNLVMEKAKRRAMGIVARGDFDPFLFVSDYSGANNDSDDDGYEASFGGGDGVGGKVSASGVGDYENSHYIAPTTKQVVDTNAITRCYQHNFGVSEPDDSEYSGVQSGEDLIVECAHKFAKADSSDSFANPADGTIVNCNNGHEVGDGEFTNNEEACWKLDPNNPDTDGDGYKDEADLSGLGQSQLTWTFEPGDRVGVIIEGTSTMIVNDNAINPYYKITWAGLDICDNEEIEGESKRDLIENDECDDTEDYGFTFLASKPVFEKAEELLKSNLNFTPQNPLFNVENNDYSDYITVNANFVQNNINDDFIYYYWDVYYCEENNLDTCTENPNNKLTTACTDGDSLGSCSGGNLISDSYVQGLGINQIKFKLNNAFISSVNNFDNFYLKVFLRTKNSRNDSRVGISSVDIPVFVNDNTIKFFKVSEQSNGEYSFDENTDEICASGLYNQICPVFPNQILVAKANLSDNDGISTVEAYSWEMNGEKILAPKTGSASCSFSNDGCSLGDTVYLPISGVEQELQSISLKIKKTEGEEITSERIISVASPMVKIVTNNNLLAWPWLIEDGTLLGTQSDNVFVGLIGETVSFRANLIPDYLNNDLVDNRIVVNWYLNNQKVDAGFISANYEQEIVVSDQDISFKLTGEEGDSINLTVEVEKFFTDEDKQVLKNNWDILGVETLNNRKTITLKQTNSPISNPITKGNSVQMFMASTFNNAPDYLIFIIRTAIVFVIFWTFTFGFQYWFNREFEIHLNSHRK